MEDHLIAPTKRGEYVSSRQVSINLDDLMEKGDYNHLIFEPLPKSSHLYIKSNVPCKNKSMSYYENLLQITVKNFGIILNLEMESSIKRKSKQENSH